MDVLLNELHVAYANKFDSIVCIIIHSRYYFVANLANGIHEIHLRNETIG